MPSGIGGTGSGSGGWGSRQNRQETNVWLQTSGVENLRRMVEQYKRMTFTQPFGPSKLEGEPSYQGYPNFHMGVDFVLPGSGGGYSGNEAKGAMIRAPASGVVTYAGWHPEHHGLGNAVFIKAPNGFEYRICHMSTMYTRSRRNSDYGGDETAPTTQVGDKVYAGDIIGQQGDTGYATGVHVHLEVRDPQGRPQDLGKDWSQIMGSLAHGLGWGGGYDPGHYGAVPPWDHPIFQLPVPIPFATGQNPYDNPKAPQPLPVDTAPPGEGAPQPTPIGYFPGDNGGGGFSLDPFGGVTQAATSALPGIVVGLTGGAILIVGLIALIRQTDVGKTVTNDAVKAGKAAVVA